MKSVLLPFAYIALSSYFILLLVLLFVVKCLNPFAAFLQEKNTDNFNDGIF